MILPIHLAAGALAQRSTKRWYLWVPLALASHQVLDWTNGKLMHDASPWPFVLLNVLGTVIIAWYGRRQWQGMGLAILPDIIDHGPIMLGLITRAEWFPLHRHWMWATYWQQPAWAFAWLALAVIILLLILRERV